MKKRGGGKAKGSAFERETAKALSHWLTGGVDGKQLIRSVLSGGWHGARVQDGWRQAGDLAPNGPEGEKFRAVYAVECKHYKAIDLYGLWTKQSQIRQWWAKLCAEASTANVQPLLIFRGNQRPTMIAMASAVYQYLLTTPGDGFPMGHPTLPGAHFTGHGLALLPFDAFLRLPPALLLSYRRDGVAVLPVPRKKRIKRNDSPSVQE